MDEQRSPCSVVLEGGVTSAVIYASLLARLSKHYSYRQLGGASSGAIAAAAAAAAEFARMSSPTTAATTGPAPAAADPFAELGKFPRQLAKTDAHGRTALYNLFQPSAEARASFLVAMAVLEKERDEGWWAICRRVVLALVIHFWPAALLLITPLVLLAVSATDRVYFQLGCRFTPSDLTSAFAACLWAAGGWLIVIVLAAVGALTLLVAIAVCLTFRALHRNHWGLCSGLTQTDRDQGEGLTPTLYGFFQGLAGRDMAIPLTLGDLWWGPRREDGSRDESGPRQIDLQVITTAVNLQRPVRLPGEPGDDPMREYFYDPAEWEALFPKPVVAYLKARGRPVTLQHDDGRELLALPPPKDWPVLMAARFSLSFPVLLSAVPMYIAVPRRAILRSAPGAKGRPFEARKVYFSDGGITSNCPIHLFDAPLPRFPTFGINLYVPKKDGDMRCVVRSDDDDPELRSRTIDDGNAWRNPVPFLKAIFETMFGWRDNLQRLLPGYRERIVHIAVPPAAGGLHLAMKTDTILLLATLGKIAARRLRRDFSLPRTVGSPTAWERHRWTRALSTLSALRKYLTDVADRVGAGDPDYDRLLRQSTPDRYAFADEAARQQALGLVHDIQALVCRLEAANPDDAMDGNRPTPQPKLHMSPPW